MRWQIADYLFCEQQQTLCKGEQEYVIEPMLVSLLAYFCRHPDKIISRQELIDAVWQGRVVSDSAVNRAITKLRKCLNDDPKKPQYIATFPKKGYRFIAPVNIFEQAPVNQSNVRQNVELKQQSFEQTPPNKSFNWRTIRSGIYLLSILIMLISLHYFSSNNVQNISSFQRMKPLTLEAGHEDFPEFSPNGQYFSYSKVKQGVMTSWLRDNTSNETIQITHDELDAYWLGPVSWSKDSSTIAYLVTTAEQCLYFTRQVKGLTLSEPQLIYECAKGSAGRITFLHDNHRLVFSEKSSEHHRYELFELNLQSNAIVKLNQPTALMAGNTQFDVHPEENSLLISSPNNKQWMVFYKLDIDTNELTELFKQDAYICCGIWSHDGNRIILMGEHPSQELLSFDLRGGNKKVIVNSNEILFRPVRHSNGIDYLFSLSGSNQNIFIADVTHAQLTNKTEIVDTSVDDRLGRLSNNGEYLAFVSLRSDQEQVWLYDQSKRKQFQLTDLSVNARFYDLAWSPDGQTLAALTLNHLYLISIDDKKVTQIPTSQKEVAGISFRSEQLLTFSQFENNQWQVYQYNMQTKQVSALDKNWKFVDFSAGTKQGLWLNQQSQLHLGDTLVEQSKLLTKHLMHQRRFNLKYQDDSWYYINHQTTKRPFIQLKNNQEKVLIEAVPSFDLQGSQLSYSQELQHNTDLYTTE